MNRTFYLFLGLSLFLSHSIFAQESQNDSIPKSEIIKTDSLEHGVEEMPELGDGESKSKDTKWDFSATLNGDYRTGNLDRSLVTIRTNLDFVSKKSVFGFYSSPSFSYGKTNGVLQERETKIDLNPTLFYATSNVYGLGFAIFESSNLRGFSSRYYAGIGLGIRLLGGIGKAKARFKITTTHAILREVTDYINATDIDVVRYSARIKLSGSWLDNKLTFFSTSFLQPALNKNNFRWNGIAGFNYKISKKIAFNLSYDISHESVVIEGRKNTDEHLMFGLAFSL